MEIKILPKEVKGLGWAGLALLKEVEGLANRNERSTAPLAVDGSWPVWTVGGRRIVGCRRTFQTVVGSSVYQSCTDMGQSSPVAGPIVPDQSSEGNPSEADMAQQDPMGGSRQNARLSRIGVRSIY